VQSDFAGSRFLNELLCAVVQKQKSLKHRGKFDVETGADRQGEWIRFMFRRANGPHVVVEVTDEQRGNLYLRSARRADRGRVLYRLENIHLVGNATELKNTILKTFAEAGYSEACHAGLQECWAQVSCRVVN
jgi:hypothetical protein